MINQHFFLPIVPIGLHWSDVGEWKTMTEIGWNQADTTSSREFSPYIYLPFYFSLSFSRTNKKKKKQKKMWRPILVTVHSLCVRDGLVLFEMPYTHWIWNINPQCTKTVDFSERLNTMFLDQDTSHTIWLSRVYIQKHDFHTNRNRRYLVLFGFQLARLLVFQLINLISFHILVDRCVWICCERLITITECLILWSRSYTLHEPTEWARI